MQRKLSQCSSRRDCYCVSSHAHRTPVAIGFIASEATTKFASALGSLAPLELHATKMDPSPDVDAAVVQATKALGAVDDARAQAWAAV